MKERDNVVAMRQEYAVQADALQTNKLIRNTYILLSMTLLFSAAMAGAAMLFDMPRIHPILTLVGFLGLFFLVAKLRNSVWALPAVFLLTGFMGLTIGPVIELYLTMFRNGHELVIMAFGSTAVIFLGLSGYALTTRKDFSYLGSFLFIGLLVALVAIVANLFLQIPALSLALSAMVVLLMAGYILYDTSNIVNGYETNYVMATVALYVDIYNLFINLLALFGFGFGEE